MPNHETRFLVFSTAEGTAAVVGGTRGLARVYLPGREKEDLRARIREEFPGAVEDGRGLRRAARAVTSYFDTGRLAGVAVKLDLAGVGDFRRQVYDELARIPAGETVTYGELARRIGRPGAHRSVGTALSRNPLPLFVPCHRVVRGDGGLGGFTAEGGVDLKRRMLDLEARGA